MHQHFSNRRICSKKRVHNFFFHFQKNVICDLNTISENEDETDNDQNSPAPNLNFVVVDEGPSVLTFVYVSDAGTEPIATETGANDLFQAIKSSP